MRPNALVVLAMFVFMSPGLVTYAVAQRHGMGGGAPQGPHISAPRVSAPAPHISPPAPHVSAPRFAVPHAATPSPRIAAPRMARHVGTQRFSAPHVAAPHASSRRFTAPHIAVPRRAPLNTAVGRFSPRSPGGLARHNVGPRVSNSARTIGRVHTHALAPSTARQVRGNPRTEPGWGAGDIARAHRAIPGASETVGQAPAAANHNPAQSGRGQMQGANHAPILRNATFAGLSPRNAETRALTTSTFRGRFAQSGFARERDRRHQQLGIVLGFVGPLFWPYAYDDFIDYTFSPYAYDTFWPYAYDDLFEGIYGAYSPEYYSDAYAYAGVPASGATYAYATGSSRRGRTAALTRGTSQICSSQAQGLADFPIEQIAQQVEPDQNQQALLDDLKAATAQAVRILQATCPSELPSTVTGQLAAMRSRVETMLQAVQVVRPALDRFYRSLNDEQKERFNALDQAKETSGHQQLASLCNERTAQSTRLPIDRIESTLRLSDDQDAALKDLNDASTRAADIMKANCQPDQTVTPTGRVALMEDQLSAMLKALDAVQSVLVKFYDSLGDEQKARFNRLNAPPV